MHPIPSRVYGWRKVAGCGDARERGGRGAGKIDPPPKHNGRPGENSLLDRQRKRNFLSGNPIMKSMITGNRTGGGHDHPEVPI